MCGHCANFNRRVWSLFKIHNGKSLKSGHSQLNFKKKKKEYRPVWKEKQLDVEMA